MQTFHRTFRVFACSVMLGIACVLSAPTAALACPSCALGRDVNAVVFGGDWGITLLLVISPLLIMGALAALLHRVGARSSPTARSSNKPASLQRLAIVRTLEPKR